jgi:hypothetical protein
MIYIHTMKLDIHISYLHPCQVPLAMALYQELRPLGGHGGLALAVALSTAGEVAMTGWSERFGVHMGALAWGCLGWEDLWGRASDLDKHIDNSSMIMDDHDL